MANTNPGGVDLDTSPYFDDYDEDKKFVRVLYRPGRAVQARELTQAQTLQQVQTRRFAEYFFKQGALVDGCEQNLDLNLSFVKLQTNYNATEVDVEDFDDQIIYGANSGIKAYPVTVTDIDGDDPKTLFISYATNGTQVLTVNVAPSTLTSGNTITFSTGNTATIEAFYTDPISGAIKIFVSNTSGTLTATTANTILSTGATQAINVTNVSDQSANTSFANSETIFTANTTTRAYALAAATNAVRNVVDEGLATEQVYNYGSKITVSEGVVYVADHFVKHSTQTIILDKYTNEPSYKVGLVPNKSFVDYIEDPTLVDNAQGTPNFQAPGADRLKIDTTLTKIVLNETTDEDEFITITEIVDGVARKRKSITVDSKLEEVLAKRTDEESGDYTLSDPIVVVREHLLNGDNGGRYTSAEGGNSDLLLVEVDPFTSYVSGYRNQIIAKTSIELEKGLDTQYVNATKTQINYGQYIEVKEVVGGWDIMESTTVDLYNTAQQVITNLVHSTATVAGSAIGTARVRSIEYVSGTKGTADARYYLYLYDIVMTTGKDFKDARSIYDSATPKRFADIVTTAAGAVLQETSFNTMIFPLPYDAIKTVRDDSENVDTAFRFKKKFTVSFSSGVATIATDVVSETFVGGGGGILSTAQKNDYYMVVVNNAGANVTTSTLTGTVTVGVNNTTVTGSGTAFTTQLNVGDLVTVNGLTRSVANIALDTLLTLATAHTTGASSNTFTKTLATGTILSLHANGGSGATRTVNSSSPGTVAIDVKESATFTADVIVSMDRANAKEKIKTLSFQTQTNINPNIHPNLLSGPFGLGVGDIYQLHAVYQSPDFNTAANTASTDVTANYVLDNGQRDYAYEHGTITPITGYVPTGRLLAVFDNFTHDTTQGVGYTSVNSYPVDDDATSNTTITTGDIPTFTSPTTKKVFKLRDSIDFRPIKTANTSLNPIDVGTYQIPTFGLRIPESGSDFDADLIYYKGKISKVYINNNGVFGINDGVSAQAGNQRAESPPTKPDTLEIAEFNVPAFPSLPSEVKIRLLKNKRFTMRDVAKINERLERLEYFTALSFLEKQATDTTELDNDGIDRFKNGILVDPFTGWSIASTSSDGKDCAIDKTNKLLTCLQDNANTIGFGYSTTAPLLSTTIESSGGKIMLPHTEVEVGALKQPYASRQLRLAEELNFVWVGDLIAVPFADSFFKTENDTTKAVVYDDDNGAENWKNLVTAWNTEVAPLNQKWIGTPTTTTTATTTLRGDTNLVTIAVQETRQSSTFEKAIITNAAAAKKETNFDRVVQVEATLQMRERDFIIHATALKDNARVYAFFDGVDVTTSCRQIQLVGASTTAQTLNSKFDSAGNLTVDTNAWTVIANGLTQSLKVIKNEIYLVFRVPAGKFYTGQREFKVTDSPTNSDGTTLTSAKNTIYSQGIAQKTGQVTINSRPPTPVTFTNTGVVTTLTNQIRSTQTVITRQPIPVPPAPPPAGIDPLSQSFFVDGDTFKQGFFITSIDLFFRTKSTETNLGVTVEIRELDNGYPSPQFINKTDSARVLQPAIQISEDATLATKFTFKNPIYLKQNKDYCFTVKPDGNDPNYAIWVAELGAIDVTNPQKKTRIESAYNSGILFSSSDDKTWTARQNIDMKFTMRIAKFETSEKIAYFNNLAQTSTFTYDALTPIIGEVELAGTDIKYEIKTSDSTFAVDSDYTTVKNYERLVLRSRKQISNTASETASTFKSFQIKATLSSSNENISPYIDNQFIRFCFDKNIINNLDSTAITGTVTYNSSNNIVVGSGTDFSNTVFAGEYAYFGDEYRKVSSVTNNVHLTVQNNFTTSNSVSQAMTIRNEENPVGPYSSQSRYITKVVTLNDGFEAADLVTYLRINRPPGTSIKVYTKLLNENDTDAFDDKFYTPMELVGTETFTLNQGEYKEEKYVVPSVAKTGGSELLSGTVATSNVSTTVSGTSTRFIEDLKIGDTIAVGLARTEKVVATIANNESLTVESVFSTLSSGEDVFRVLNNTVAYTTPDGRTFQGYKQFAIKIVFLSSNPSYASKVKDLRGIALA